MITLKYETLEELHSQPGSEHAFTDTLAQRQAAADQNMAPTADRA